MKRCPLVRASAAQLSPTSWREHDLPLIAGFLLSAPLWLLLTVRPSNAATMVPAQPATQPSLARSFSSWIDSNAGLIAGNPGAVNFKPGIGLIGRILGFGPDSGVSIGGLWVGNADYLAGSIQGAGTSTAWAVSQVCSSSALTIQARCPRASISASG